MQPPSLKIKVQNRVTEPGAGLVAILLAFFWLLNSDIVRAAELPRGFVEETLATNLNAVTSLAAARDGRVFIADQTGKIRVWKNGALLPQPALTLPVTDYWERGLDGIVLHPDFPNTPHIYVIYVTERPFVHHVISHFTMAGDVIDPASETILFEGDDQGKLGGKQPAGHQGGAMRFGHDGKLYVSIGEQTAGEPAQRLDTLQGKILRLNDDGTIPLDNPFRAQTKGKYAAIYAYGVRNSFGIAVQPREDGGRMFFTDVGGSAFEEVNELVQGANYGWPRAEGYSQQAEFKSPLHAYPPVIGQSICGGTFYPRQPGAVGAFPEKWRGKFFFVDFMKHWIKAIDPASPANTLSFARGLNGPIAVEAMPDGSLLVLNRGTIWRDPKRFVADSGSLVRIKYTGQSAPVVTQVSTGRAALGLPMTFAGMPKLYSQLPPKVQTPVPAAKIVTINSPPWNPGIDESVMLALPAEGKIHRKPEGALEFPAGTVLIRTFLMSGRRTVETRLTVLGEQYGWGASYRWRDDASDADLVEDGELAALSPKTQWYFPALDDRLSWPTANLSYALPLTVAQLNTPDDLNILEWWSREGKMEPPVEKDGRWALPMAVGVEGPASAEVRVRSYLDANCAVCHQPGGAARANFDARLATPLDKTGLIDGDLAAGDLGIAGAKVVVPGNVEKSILYQRLKRTDFFRMPPIQFHNELPPILPVMEEWIKTMKTK